MSSVKIVDLPNLATANLSDYVIISHLDETDVRVTSKITVQNLLGSGTPKPSAATLTWDGIAKQLTVKAKNLLPNSTVQVDSTYYSFETYSYVGTDGTVVLDIPSIEIGEHNVTITNGVHNLEATFTTD